MAFHGEYWMQNTLEHPSEEEECMLSAVLSRYSPPRYFLNREQLQSLVDRASDREKSLPKDLETAIKQQIAMLSNTPQLEENIMLDRKPRDIVMTEKRTRSTQGEVPMLYVRRMSHSECEKLQGFPVGWTEIDPEQ